MEIMVKIEQEKRWSASPVLTLNACRGSVMANNMMELCPPQGKVNKTCFRCGKLQPLQQFYRHSRMADGRLNKCIDCAKADQRKHYRNTIEDRKAYERKRASLPHRVQASRDYLATPDGKLAKRRALEAYYARNPEKRRAHIAVGNAVRDGKLVKPSACDRCHVECSTKRSLHAHHHDYSKPLAVEWLCGTCHRLEHRPER